MKPQIEAELGKYIIPDLKLVGVCSVKLLGFPEEKLVLEGKVIRVEELKDINDVKIISEGLPPNSIRTAPNEHTTF